MIALVSLCYWMLLIVGRLWEPDHATWQITLCSFRRIKINLKTIVLSVIAARLSHNNGVLIYVTVAGKPTLVGLLERTFFSPWHLKTKKDSLPEFLCVLQPESVNNVWNIIAFYYKTPSSESFQINFLRSLFERAWIVCDSVALWSPQSTWCKSHHVHFYQYSITTQYFKRFYVRKFVVVYWKWIPWDYIQCNRHLFALGLQCMLLHLFI